MYPAVIKILQSGSDQLGFNHWFDTGHNGIYKTKTRTRCLIMSLMSPDRRYVMVDNYSLFGKGHLVILFQCVFVALGSKYSGVVWVLSYWYSVSLHTLKERCRLRLRIILLAYVSVCCKIRWKLVQSMFLSAHLFSVIRLTHLGFCWRTLILHISRFPTSVAQERTCMTCSHSKSNSEGFKGKMITCSGASLYPT